MTSAVDRQGGASPNRRGTRVWVGGLLIVALGTAVAFPVLTSWRHERRQTAWKATARAAVEAKDWSLLEDVVGEWLAADADSDDAHLFAAEAAAQRGDAELAAEHLGAVGRDYHGYVPAALTLAELLFADLNRPLEAVAVWEELLNREDAPAAVFEPLIYFYAMTLQRERLRRTIRTALDARAEPPGAYVYLTSSDGMNFSDGLPKLRRWRQNAPDSEELAAAEAVYAARFTASNELAESGSRSVAAGERRALYEALERYPSNLTLLAEAAAIAVLDGDEEAVYRYLSAAGPAAGADGRFWRFRGWLLGKRGETGKAAEALQKAVDLDPYDWRSRFQLAEAYRLLGREEASAELAETAMRGKTLEGEVLALPNSRSLTRPLVEKIRDYMVRVDDAPALEALDARL